MELFLAERLRRAGAPLAAALSLSRTEVELDAAHVGLTLAARIAEDPGFRRRRVEVVAPGEPVRDGAIVVG